MTCPPNPPFDPTLLLPKILGGDFELGILEEGNRKPPSDEPAEAILAEVDGIPAFRRYANIKLKPIASHSSVSASSASLKWQSAETRIDHGRKYLRENGGCIYIDSMHPEIAFPETRSAVDFVRVHREMLAVAVQALESANRERRGSLGRLRLLTSNSDGKGNAWGTHLDFFISRQAFRNIMHRRPHYLALLASVHAAGVLFGQGKVGAENGKTPVPFQLSQRVPDFFGRVSGLDTMCANRGLVNTRDEALCGDRDSEFARYHGIPYDHALCRYADWLKVGHLQLILSLIEAEWVPVHLILEDPPQAAFDWGRDQTLYDGGSDPVDPDPGAKARLITGEAITLATYHRRLEAYAREYYESGPEVIDRLVPDAKAILDAWDETATRLRERDIPWLSRRFDAWLKRGILVEAMRQDPGLEWDSTMLRAIDHLYGELPNGLFFQLEEAGEVETFLPGVEMRDEPHETRAGVRAKLLSAIPREDIVRVNWDEIAFEHEGKTYRLDLPDPAMRLSESPPIAALVERFIDGGITTAPLPVMPSTTLPPSPPPPPVLLSIASEANPRIKLKPEYDE